MLARVFMPMQGTLDLALHEQYFIHAFVNAVLELVICSKEGLRITALTHVGSMGA